VRPLRMEGGIWSQSKAGISISYQARGVVKCDGLVTTRIDSSRPGQLWNRFENLVC
jgi:hypothetical protein